MRRIFTPAGPLKGALSQHFPAALKPLQAQVAQYRIAPQFKGLNKSAFKTSAGRAGIAASLDRIMMESRARQYSTAVTAPGSTGLTTDIKDQLPTWSGAKKLSDLETKYPDAGKSDAALEAKVYNTLKTLEAEVVANAQAWNTANPYKPHNIMRAMTDMPFLIISFCFVLFCIFLYNQYLEFVHELHFEIRDGLFGAGFYFLLGLHGVHVCIGTVMLGVLAYIAAIGALNPQSLMMRCTSLYVHLVDLVFVVIVFSVYSGSDSPNTKLLVGELAPTENRISTVIDEDGNVLSKEF